MKPMSGLLMLCASALFAVSLAKVSVPPSVAADAAFNISMVTGIVYAQGLIDVGTPQQRAVNLTLDAYVPRAREGGPPVPRARRPALMFVHGGGFMGSILDPDKANHIVDDVEYFVKRGFVGFQLNYRLGQDNASFPTAWPAFPRTGGAALGVQPGPIAAGSPMFESQRFKLGSTGLLTLANDDELCVRAAAPGGSVSLVPCPRDGAAKAGSDDTFHWRFAGSSVKGVGGAFDGKCLGTQAPSGAGVDKRAFVGRMSFRCDTSDPSQHWEASDVGGPQGMTICHPANGTRTAGAPHYGGGSATGAGPAQDVGCLSFAGGFNPPVSHLYPAVRDIKAAVRWLRAEGAARFNVDPSYLTLDGGSAGACTILGAGLAQEHGDYTTEVPQADDPTLATTHLEQSDAVRSMVVHWGAPFAVDIATVADPQHRSRYRRSAQNPLPSIIAYNGLVDTTVPIEHIRAVQRAYDEANATIVVRPLPNQPHACWDATVTVDGVVTTQSADAFAFIRREQQLLPIGA